MSAPSSGKARVGPIDFDFYQRELTYRFDPSLKLWLGGRGAYDYVVRVEDGTYVAEDARGRKLTEGTDAASVINSAISALTSGRTWKETVLLKGNFTLSSKISLASYTRLVIDGKLSLADGADDHMIEGIGLTEVEILGGELDGNKANQTAGVHCIRLVDCSKVRVAHIYIHDGYTFGIFVTANTSDIFDIVIENIRVESCGGNNIHVGPSTGYKATDVMLRNIVTKSSGGDGIELVRVMKSILDSIYAEGNTTYGISLDVDAKKNIISDVHAIQNQHGIGINGTGAEENLVVSSIAELNSQMGFYITQAKNKLDSIVSRLNGYRGVQISASDVELRNSRIYNNSQASPGTYDGVYISGNALRVIVEANYIYDDQATPTQAYGINEFAADYSLIRFNKLWGNSAGQIAVSGANSVVKYNDGYVTENSGTATFSGDGSTTSFSWAHGLVGTPSVVVVTAASADAAGDFHVTADATNITITYAAAPAAGTDNVVLWWYAEV